MRRNLIYVTGAIALNGCSSPQWPHEHFPDQMSVSRTLFAKADSGVRETCEAIVVELTDSSAMRVMYVPHVTKDGPWAASPRNGWHSTSKSTPIGQQTYFTGAFGGCNTKGARPPGDFPGALQRPGAFYKIINGGEGIAIIMPRAKLAGYFYFG